jgi:hypothetical protein
MSLPADILFPPLHPLPNQSQRICASMVSTVRGTIVSSCGPEDQGSTLQRLPVSFNGSSRCSMPNEPSHDSSSGHAAPFLILFTNEIIRGRLGGTAIVVHGMCHDLESAIREQCDRLSSYDKILVPGQSENFISRVRNLAGFNTPIAIRWRACSPQVNFDHIPAHADLRPGQTAWCRILIDPAARYRFGLTFQQLGCRA